METKAKTVKVKAYIENGNFMAIPVDGELIGRAMKLSFSQSYPKALKALKEVKKFTGTIWKAINSKTSWDAVELL